MQNQFDALKLAKEVETDTTLCSDLLSQGQTLYSPHPTKKGLLIEHSASGKVVGVLKEGRFIPVGDK